MSETGRSRNCGAATFVSGIVLAGGESRRMGRRNKALLEIGGRPIVSLIVQTLSEVFLDVIIVTNSPDQFKFLGLPMFQDLRRGFGALGGIYTGLSCCKGDYGFLVACDMPFIRRSVIEHMLSRLQGQDVVIPRIRGRLEPLHAIYSRACVPYMRELIARGDRKILNLFDQVNVLEIPETELAPLDPDLQFVANLNTLEDLEKARRAGKRQPEE